MAWRRSDWGLMRICRRGGVDQVEASLSPSCIPRCSSSRSRNSPIRTSARHRRNRPTPRSMGIPRASIAREARGRSAARRSLPPRFARRHLGNSAWSGWSLAMIAMSRPCWRPAFRNPAIERSNRCSARNLRSKTGSSPTLRRRIPSSRSWQYSNPTPASHPPAASRSRRGDREIASP